MSAELKPCPFCESEELQQWSRYIECMKCGAQGPFNDPKGEKWNAAPRKEGETTANSADVSS